MTDPSEREVCHKYMDVNLTGEVDAEFRSGFFHGWQARAALPGPSVEAIADAICGAREAWASDKHGTDFAFGTDYNAHLARAVLALFPAAPQAVRAFFEAAKADCAAIKRGGVGMVRANAEKWAAYDAMQEAADAE